MNKEDDIREYLSELGKKGGSSKSKAKRAAARKNAKAARDALAKKKGKGKP